MNRRFVLTFFILLASASAQAEEPVDLAQYIHAPRGLMIADAGMRLSSDGAEAAPGTDDQSGHGLHAVHPGADGYVFTTARADAYAPIGVMGEHTHTEGDFMLSYRYMRMRMQGMRDGDSRVSNADVRGDGFMVVPTDMDMQMHMFGGMYAPTDRLTLMVMVPYLRNTMHHKAGAPLGSVQFDTASEGLGDVSLSGIYHLCHSGHHNLQASFGVSFPTGSIDERDNTPAGNVVLPYPMQLGSGTYDLLTALTYVYQTEQWSAGGQSSGVIRLGTNDHEYRLGDRFAATGWFAWKWCKAFSTSARLNYQLWANLDGADPNFVRTGTGEFLAPTMDPDLRGGQRLDVLIGANLLATEGPLKGHRLAVEFGVPVYQNLDGPQLETDWILTAGWQFAF